MQIPKPIEWMIRLGVPLMIGALIGCSTPTSQDDSSFSFSVKQLKGRARCFSDGSTNAQALKVGDRLRAGYLVQTPADLGHLDLSARGFITVRFYPDTLIGIAKATRGFHGDGDTAELELRRGRIYVRAEHSGICQVSFTNGVVRICDGVVGVYERGRVDALTGSAFVTMMGQNEPTRVPQGYTFDPVSGKIDNLALFH